MSKRDAILVVGLVLIGAGLFFQFGPGAALAVPGVLLWAMGASMRGS